jgi:hypothetical protein
MMEFDESPGEIRPGRTVVRRRITIIGRQPTPSTNKKINLLFVHGSCAASSQYDDLIAEMRRKLALAQDNDHLPAMNCFLYDWINWDVRNQIIPLAIGRPSPLQSCI